MSEADCIICWPCTTRSPEVAKLAARQMCLQHGSGRTERLGIDPEPMVFPQPAPARRSLARAAGHDRMVARGSPSEPDPRWAAGNEELAGARPRTAAARTTLNRA